MADRKSFWLFTRFSVMAMPCPRVLHLISIGILMLCFGQEMFETTMKESEGGLANANELPEFL